MKRFTVAFILFLLAVAAMADEQNLAKGFSADKAYDGGQVDSINLYNGNLNLTIPLGQKYVVSSALSYQFTLVYAGNNWDMEWEETFPPPLFVSVTKHWYVPSRSKLDNAGFGWRVSFGAMEHTLYISPDGARHPFAPTLHPVAVDPDPDVFYSQDSTYLRLRVLEKKADGNPLLAELDFPDGTVHLFKYDSMNRGELQEMRDPFGNKVVFTRTPVNIVTTLLTIEEKVRDLSTPANAPVTRRRHTMTLRRLMVTEPLHEDDPTEFTVIDNIDLEAFDGARAVYQFEYEDDGRVSSHEPVRISRLLAEGRHVQQDCTVARTTFVPLLKRVMLPCTTATCTADQRGAYTVVHDRGNALNADGTVNANPSYSHVVLPVGSGTDCPVVASVTGHPLKLTLPTRGTVAWTYRQWSFAAIREKMNNIPSCPTATGVPGPCIDARFQQAIGVATRKEFDGNGTTLLSSRQYDSALFGPTPDERHTAITTVTSFDPKTGAVLNTSLHYHHQRGRDDTSRGIGVGEYGLPYTREADPDPGTKVANPGPWPESGEGIPLTDSRNGYLSTKLYDAAGNLLTYTYVRYERDAIRPDTNDNRRVVAQSTVHVESPTAKTWVLTRHEQFDGLGHFRRTERFNQGSLFKRRTTTSYNPNSPDYTPGGPFTHPTTWVLNNYTTSTVADLQGNTVLRSQTTDSCFDNATGLLLRVRTRRALPSALNDFLTVFTPERRADNTLTGNIASEAFYGGDLTPLPSTFGGGCNDAITAAPAASRTFAYTHNVRSRVQIAGVAFPSVNLEIDASTGEVEASLDPANRRTKYSYDVLGRITKLEPPGVAWSKYTYDFLTPPVKTIVQQFAPGDTTTPLTEAHAYYDGLGRIVQQKRRMPDGWSTTHKTYDGEGRAASATVATFHTSSAFSPTLTAPETLYSYDALGRIVRTREPDGSEILHAYVGAREATRTVTISTVANPDGEPVTTKETYDYLGRVASVAEPSGSSGESIITTYTYDTGDRITSVTSGADQTRTFVYDGAGLLLEEDHPEMAVTKYTYDARRNVVRKLGPTATLLHAYDAAGRLRSVKDETANAELKLFDYDTAELGKLTSQTRRNVFTDRTYTVKDTFTYDATSGLTSRKETSIADGATTETFTQNYDYTPLGAPAHVQFPTCGGCGGVATGERDLTLEYIDGLLTGIERVTTTIPNNADGADITYTASGATHLVQHANADGTAGVIDKFEPDGALPRVGSIAFEGANACDLKITTPPQNKTIQAGGTTPLSVTATGSAPLTYRWYEGALGDTSKLVSTAASFTTPALTQTTDYWVEVANPCGSARAAARVTVCGTTTIPISVAPPVVVEGTPFQLQTPEIPGATYRWYRGPSHADGILIGTTQVPRFDIAGITQETRYFVTAQDAACFVNPVKSAILVVTPCMKPLPREIRATVKTGKEFILSVPALPEDAAGVTFEWFEGASNSDTSKPLGTGSSITTVIENVRSFWVRMTRACGGGVSAVSKTAVATVDSGCLPFIFEQPVSAATTPTYEDWSNGTTPILRNSTLTATVRPGGPPPHTIAWYDVNDPNTAIGNSETFSWTSTGVNATRTVYAVVSRGAVRAESERIALSFAPTPQKITDYTAALLVYDPNDQVKLSVTMSPAPAVGIHDYSYKWTGGAGGGTTTSPQLFVRARDGVSYRVVVTGTHTVNGFRWTETTTRDMALLVYGTCTIPPVTVEQNVFKSCSADTGVVTFRATCNWPDVRFQWFAGEPGDTRSPITAAPSHDNELTLTSNIALRVWARASVECGATSDSNDAVYRRGNCVPVDIDPNLQSIEIAWDATMTLSTTAINVPRPGYQWYEGTTQLTNNAPTLTQPNRRKSGRFRVEVRDLDCAGSMASSYWGTVRVATADNITTPSWQTVVWTGADKKATLSAATAGAIGYQWYTGEVGDESGLIANATGSTYTTPALTADARYWVRVKGNLERLIDSPTITVRVCDLPRVTTKPTFNHNIIPGQTVWFSVNAAGTNLQYQWFEGPFRNTSKPVGQPVYGLKVSPNATTTYWLRITGTCGGAPVVVDEYVAIDPATSQETRTPLAFTASVCPSVGAVSIAPPKVMPNGTAQLSVTATGTSLSYAWYIGQPGNTSQPIANSNAATITTPPIPGPTSYWVRVTSGGCTRDSEGVSVSMCQFGPTVSLASPRNIFYNDSTTLQFPPMSPVVPKRITWYRGASGDRSTPVSTASGATSLDYTTPRLTQTTQYWMEFEYEGCITVSNTVTVQVCKPTITAHPQSTTMLSGTSKTLTVTATGSPLTYQWYIGATGDVSQPITNATAASINVSPAATTSYWVRVTGCSTTADSNAAVVTVCTMPVVTVTKSTSSAPGLSGTLTANVTGGSGLTYQWFKGQSGDTTRPISGATASTYTFTLRETDFYWVRVTSACDGTAVNSAAIQYSVQAEITSHPQDAGICNLGDSATFSVTATGTYLSYEWRRNGSLLAGETSSTLTIPITDASATFYAIVRSGTASRNSLSAGVFVNPKPTLSISKTNASAPGSYRLFANLPDEETALGVTYQWYQGALGNTSTPLGTTQYITVSPTPPVTYWVRVKFTATGCYADKATSF